MLTVEFTVVGVPCLGLNGGPFFKHSEAFSFQIRADVSEMGMQKLPVGKGSAEKVVVKYPSEGGYTPGDTWDLYLGPDQRVQEFAYHRGGSGQPKLITARWEGYQKAGPLLFSTSRPGKANHIIASRVFYSDVAVKLVATDTWVPAQ